MIYDICWYSVSMLNDSDLKISIKGKEKYKVNKYYVVFLQSVLQFFFFII